jgi:serine/threonine protein kinase/tetratricopeptide (TPR) repeat protein
MLDRERWQRVSQLLDEALDLEPAQCAAWLERLRRSEPALADDVAAVLDDHQAALRDGFLEGSASQLAAAVTLEGRRLGAYTLRAPLGQGGMGSVWRAERSDGTYEGSVAVKLLNLALIGGAGVARFRREGSILARLQHPHIAHLLDAGVSEEGQPYLVLELAEGEPIDRHCARCRLDVAARIALFLDVLGAVGHAHAHLVIHRDLKPDNVLVLPDGQVKLLDFGIAKLLEPEPLSGTDSDATVREATRALTPRYAAPEQLLGGPITTATDVYALGVLLYELLAGRHPNGTPGGAAELIRATLDSEPPRVSQAPARAAPAELERIAAERATSPAGLARQLEGDLDNIVARALRKAPSERYATVAAFADDLRRHLAHEPVSARPATLRYRAATFVRRHRGAVLSAALAVVGLVVAVVISTWQMVEARQQREEARTQAAKAEASRRFLNLMLSEIGTDGAALTPAQLLDRGAHLLDAQYASNSKFMVDQLLQLSGGYEEIDQTGKEHDVLLRAEAIARALGDNERLAETECNLVANELRLGDRVRARAAHDAAQALLARVARPSPLLRADCMQADAFFDKSEGRTREAVATLNRVLALLESTGNVDHPSYTATLTRLAAYHNDLGEPVPSLELNRRASAIYDKTGRGGTMSKIITLNNEAAALFTFGETRHAAEVQAELLKRVDARGANPDTKVSFIANYGGILTALGKPEEAIPLLRDSIAVAHAGHNTFWEQRASFQLARALVRAGQWSEGERQLDVAEAAYRRDEVMNKPFLRYVAAVRAELLLGQGRASEAKRTMDALLRDLDYPREVKALQLVSALPLAAEIELALNDAAAAEPMASAAVTLAGKMARDPAASADVGKAWLALGRVRARRGDTIGEREALTHALPSLSAGLGADSAPAAEARTRLAALAPR